MLEWFSKRRSRRHAARRIYDAVVGQARNPVFYRELGIADRLETRFELLVLHVFLALDRLQQDGTEGAALGQELVDAFVSDMDTTMRELGVGDISVAKKVRHAAAVFRERLQDYGKALAQPDSGPLETALAEAVFPGDTPSPETAAHLAGYTRAAALGLRRQALSDLSAGRLDFPEPAGEALGTTP